MPQHDPFSSQQRSLTSPANKHITLTPSDGQDLPLRPRVLRVLTDGTLSLRDDSGVIVSYAVSAGETLLFSPRGIEATGTTATAVGWL